MKGSTISKPDMMTSNNKLENSIWYVIQGIPEHEEEDNVVNVITLENVCK